MLLFEKKNSETSSEAEDFKPLLFKQEETEEEFVETDLELEGILEDAFRICHY